MNPDVKLSPDGRVYLRKSAVESFNFCPRQFYKVYMEGMPIKESYYMLQGTRFHEFAYWFFDVCESIPIEHWLDLVPNAFAPEEREMAEWWVGTEIERYKACKGRFAPLIREMKMIDDDLLLTGTVDRIDEGDSEDELIIVEYKTGRSYNEESVTRQLCFYKLIYDNTIKRGEIKYMKYINPRLKVVKMIPYNPAIMDKVFVEISKVRRAMKDGIFPVRCSPVKHLICNLCDFDECGVYDRR